MFFSTDNNNLIQVGDGCDDSGGEFDFSVGLIDFEDVVAGLIFFLDEFFHAVVDLVGAEVDLRVKTMVTLAARRVRMSLCCIGGCDYH